MCQCQSKIRWQLCLEVAEIASLDFPGERLMVCFNPRLRDKRRRKRGELLRATEDRLEEIARPSAGKDRVCATRRRPHGASAKPSAASRSPSTSRSDAKTTISDGVAGRTGSTAKRSSTDFGSSAPVTTPTASGRTGRWRRTKACPGSSKPSGRSRPGGRESGRSSFTPKPASAPAPSCACSPATPNGT